MEARQIKGNEYEAEYFPVGAFLFVRKDAAPQKIGSIITPASVRKDHSKFTSTGVVIAKSLFTVFENDREAYFHAIIRTGDRIGFGTTVPLYSPSPPFYNFDADEAEAYVTLHVTDVLAVICDTEAKRVEWCERLKG